MGLYSSSTPGKSWGNNTKDLDTEEATDDL